MNKEIELAQKSENAIETVETMKSQFKKITKIIKELVANTKNLDDRLFLLEKDWNKEKTRRTLLNSSPTSFSSEVFNTAKFNPLCSQQKDCSSCVSDPKCGWCKTQKRCVQGDAFGPLDGSCTFYDFGKCSDSTCFGYHDCDSCLISEDCGWCNDLKLCMEGTQNGPVQTCKNGYSHKDLMSICPKDNNIINVLQDSLDK